ncbi:sulfur carrier protein ThiS adenylyltransferase ThiF [Deltaproteobacteria bacterium Smac51]|nr:sulfur carrier protein ThiS adenylyltransferase ThiF [Deltaproteobacteria bacterium Smac51]
MGWPPDRDGLFSLLAARHTPEVQAGISAGRVAVAGLGGLGSHVATALARCGVGCLKLIDFDEVDESNLHRQCYFPRHVGRPKTSALKEMLQDINPYIEIQTADIRLTARNVPDVLAGWTVIVEALDDAAAKAELVTAALAAFQQARIISASGLAGLGSANDIVTRRAAGRLYVCGDGISEVAEGVSLMAPRVMVCAGHQANLAIRLLLNNQEP